MAKLKNVKVLNEPLPPRTKPPAGDEVYKHMSFGGTFHM